MASIEYKEWRRHVFQRDNYRCQSCGKRGGDLHADHELRYADYPDLRLEILNGRTLCKSCHLKTDTWGSRSKPTNDPTGYAAAVGKRLGVDYKTFVIKNIA
jgi:5-methylcytosine-specific restriction endonuclease McrA